MTNRRMLWQLYTPFLVIILVSLIFIIIYSTRSMNKFYIGEATTSLERAANLLQEPVNNLLAIGDTTAVDTLCIRLGKQTATRYTVILADGNVLGDTNEDPARMEKHDTRPEIARALSGETGSSTRYSNTLQISLLYVAVPIFRDNRVDFVIRAAIPITALGTAMNRITYDIALVGLVIAFLAALVSLLVSRRISRPLEQLKTGAERFAGGDLTYKLPMPAAEEVRGLAVAMNRMAVQLDERIRTIIRQRNEQEAMLASMTEGVLAVDTGKRILSINLAAARLFNIDLNNTIGRSILEIIRNADLPKLVNQALNADSTVEREITLNDNDERFLQAHGTPLRDSHGDRIGAMIVLNDLTRIRRLERMRKDFVANVSHELKTPVTSIKGFVETLLDGAVENTDDAVKFLNIIARQADRLNAIIDDILSLSRIEEDSEKGTIVVEERNLNNIVKAAVQTCELKSREKEIRIDVECGNQIKHRINGQLLEQALVNLIDNAIKYSEKGSPVKIVCDRDENEIRIVIQDNGVGIRKEHLPRIFERFYRVDKARSRKIGGTGLGLAIVKHIVLAHGGQVTVDSTPGQGSAFTIHLPL
nr:PAS domain-containing protein [candidate division Zixibacteria bacterium]